ncbi:DUF4113 domain-containing protein [Leptothrix cholodnii]|uniref:DUF4113 domain-containing protein n=1 Tax=Leptothrix cholodnii TaxID=34029 RepID=UPI0003216296|nr:DUF4113 domain-containing protein [Leptothrix cholodnii]
MFTGLVQSPAQVIAGGSQCHHVCVGHEFKGLMMAMDSINSRWGQGSIKRAGGRIGDMPRAWGMKQDRKTPGYTTEWAVIPPASTGRP